MAWSRTPVEPLRWWVQKVLPTVYDDSLSFQELLGKVVDKLNDIIDNADDFVNYVNEKLLNYELQLENFYNKQEVDEIVAQVTNQLGDKVDKLVELGKTVFYASVNGVQSGIEGTDEYDVGPKVAMYTNRGTLSVGDPITAHDAVSKQYLELNVVETLNDKADKTELNSKRDIVTSTGEERAYTCVGQNQSSVPVWDTLTNGSIVKRSASGTAQIANPIYNKDIANKEYVDDECAKKVTKGSGNSYVVYVHKGNSGEGTVSYSESNTNGSFVVRDNGGRIKASNPTTNNDVVTLSYFNSHIPSGSFNVTSLFSGTATAGNYIVQDISNTYKAYIIRHTAGSSGIIKDDVVYVGNNNSGNHWFTGAYGLSSGQTYAGEMEIRVPQDTTKRSLYFKQATTLEAGYGNVTITDVWGVTW